MRIYALIVSLLIALNLIAQPQKQVQLFPLSDVRLLESPFLQAQQVDLKYILTMEPDRLLAPYLREAGLTPKAPSYTNWENSGLDGHIGGHYISALAMMYASTGNKEIKQRLDYMISELKRCQDAVGTGFIGGTPGSIPMWKEVKEGNIRAGGFDLNGKWVPLYNIHKTYAGLRDAYLFGGIDIAHDMLIKLTNWMIDITSGLSDEQMQDMLRSEHGGLNETFADVYAFTGEKKYLTLAKRFSHLFILNPLLEKQDKLTGLHANTQIPKVIGYKRIADLEGNQAWDDASQFFWQTVVKNRSVTIGGNSVREHFHPTDNFTPMVTDIEGPETCNTYNMLRLSNLLYQTSNDIMYLNYYEQALYNHILSSQEPDKGGFVYFTSMRPGHYRVYSQPETSMWCCVGSGLENHTKYGELIYAHTEDALLVNLFIPSRLEWKEKGVTLTQETRFPDENQVRFRIEETGKKPFTFKVRYPGWANDFNEVTATVNGKTVKNLRIDMGYIVIDHKWKKGDQIAINFPMSLTMKQLPDKSDFYSFKYGPIVLAVKTGTNDMDGLYADDSRGGHIAHGKQIPLQEVPILVGETNKLLSYFNQVNGELRFTYSGEVFPEQFKDMEFIPFFRLHESRYAVYFRQVTPNGLVAMKEEMIRKEQAAAELAKRTVDLIYPGEQQPESDHFIKYEDSWTGNQNDRHYRMTKGWFGYDLKVKDTATTLMLILHKRDVTVKTFIHIDGTELTAAPVTADIDENFVTLTYTLPEALNSGTHTIKFTPKETGKNSNQIYEVRITN